MHRVISDPTPGRVPPLNPAPPALTGTTLPYDYQDAERSSASGRAREPQGPEFVNSVEGLLDATRNETVRHIVIQEHLDLRGLSDQTPGNITAAGSSFGTALLNTDWLESIRVRNTGH